MSPDRQDKIFVVSQGEIKNGKIDFESNSKGESNIFNKSFKYDTKKLGEIAELRRGPFGGSIKKEIFVNKSENNYQVYEQYNAINSDPYSGRYFITEKDFNRLKSFEVKPGDILMSCSGTIGKLVTIQNDSKPGIINQALLRIRLTPEINGKYFSIIFSKIIDNLILSNELSYGAAIKNIASVSELKEIEIPIPPLKTQQEIVNKMDSAMAEKKKMELESKKILENIDDYVFSELGIKLQKQKEEKRYFTIDFDDVKRGRLDVFYFSSGTNFIDDGKSYSFELRPISEVANFIPGYAFSSKDYTKQGVKLCTIKNIKPYGLDFDDVTFLPEEYLDKYDKYKIKKGDIIFAMTGATIGKLTKFEIEDNILLNQRVGIIRAKDINQDFLHCFLNTDIFNKQIIRESVGGAQANISENSIMNIKIPVPNKEIQDKIANEVKSRIEKANGLKKQASEIYEQAKNEVEKMILEE